MVLAAKERHQIPRHHRRAVLATLPQRRGARFLTAAAAPQIRATGQHFDEEPEVGARFKTPFFEEPAPAVRGLSRSARESRWLLSPWVALALILLATGCCHAAPEGDRASGSSAFGRTTLTAPPGDRDAGGLATTDASLAVTFTLAPVPFGLRDDDGPWEEPLLPDGLLFPRIVSPAVVESAPHAAPNEANGWTAHPDAQDVATAAAPNNANGLAASQNPSEAVTAAVPTGPNRLAAHETATAVASTEPNRLAAHETATAAASTEPNRLAAHEMATAAASTGPNRLAAHEMATAIASTGPNRVAAHEMATAAAPGPKIGVFSKDTVSGSQICLGSKPSGLVKDPDRPVPVLLPPLQGGE